MNLISSNPSHPENHPENITAWVSESGSQLIEK